MSHGRTRSIIFSHYSHHGFTHYFNRAKTYTPSFADFAGKIHVIIDDEDDTRQPLIPDTSISPGKSRENTFNPSHTILLGTRREPQGKPTDYTTADGTSWETKEVSKGVIW